MTKFKEIKNIIQRYQRESDKLYAEYQAKKERAKKRYAEETYKTEMMTKVWPHYSGTALANANITISEVNVVLEQVEAAFREWIMKPLKPEVLQTLNLINDFDIKLSLYELQTVERFVADSLFGSRVLAGLAKKAGYNVKIS